MSAPDKAHFILPVVGQNRADGVIAATTIAAAANGEQPEQ